MEVDKRESYSEKFSEKEKSKKRMLSSLNQANKSALIKCKPKGLSLSFKEILAEALERGG